jgi:nucleoside-diphosphate-sugar epimerase
MKIAVTGASGYVGGILASTLHAHDHEVLHWSRRKTGNLWHPYALSDDPTSLPWDGVDGLLHAAYDFTARTWEETLAINVEPSLRLLDEAARRNVKKIVFISSISSFEGTLSNYGRAKLLIEKKILEYGGTVIRPGLVWGNPSGGVMGALEKVVDKLPLVPCLHGRDGLSQFLVHEDDLSKFTASLFTLTEEPGPRIVEATNPDSVPLKEILKRLALRNNRFRLFIPIPWQVVMLFLKVGEQLKLPLPFRSDSLKGLVYRTPELLDNDLSSLRKPFRPLA